MKGGDSDVDGGGGSQVGTFVFVFGYEFHLVMSLFGYEFWLRPVRPVFCWS